ncbi:MAG: prepilin-type N-terminal cleavage/methylation domain-containing protein [bacterium]|nr:prepilin-type N-terminal cleavage/methylation domain-containing protein [bacterium]
MIKLLKSKRGFTLVEIMIVVAIIGLLAAIAIPNFIKSRSRSRDAVCVNGMKQIASALEQVCMEENLDATNGGAGFAAGAIVWDALPVTGAWGIVGSTAYLKTAPACPIAAGAYTAGSSTVGVFQITCPSLTSHGPNFQATNNPYTLQ